MDVFDILGAFLPPLSLMLFGYATNLLVFGRFNNWSLLKKWFAALVAGSSIIILPVSIMVLIYDHAIPTVFQWLSVIYFLLSFITVIHRRVQVRGDIHQILESARNLYNASLSGKVAIIVFVALVIIVVFSMFVGPINDSNALMVDLPLSVNIYRTGQLGPLASDYAISLLYTWTMVLTDGIVFEPFRQIPTLLILSFPILVYALTKKLLTREIAIIAFTISSVSPMLDYGIFLFAFSRDLISVILGVTSVVLFLEKEKSAYILSVLALGMSIFAKPVYGLPVMFILICLSLLSMRKYKMNLSLAFFLVGILLFGIVGDLSKFPNFSSTIFAVAFGALLIVGLMILANRTECKPFLINQKSIGFMILGFLPVFAYVIRQVSLGGAPFGLAFPLTKQDANVTWWVDFNNAIWPATQVSFATGTGPINNLYVTMLFYHPLLDPYSLIFKIIGLVTLFKKRSIALFLFLLSYFFYLGSMGPFPAGRHQILLAIFLFPVISVGISEFARKISLSQRSSGVLVALIVLMTTLNCAGLYFWVSSISGKEPWVYVKNLINFVRIPDAPYLDYTNPESIDNLSIVLLIAVCFPVVSYFFASMLKRIRIRVSFSLRFRRPRFRRLKNTFFFVIFAVALSWPPFHYYWIASDGNVAGISTSSASWYRYESWLAKELRGQTYVNETMLIFLFPSSYDLVLNRISYIDISHGLSSSYPQRPLKDYFIIRDIVTTSDLNHLKSVLSSLGVKHLLLPTKEFYNFEIYVNFNKISQMIRILNESYSIKKVEDYGFYELYEFPDIINISNGGFEMWTGEMPNRWNSALGLHGYVSREILIINSGNSSVKIVTGDTYGNALYQNGLQIQPKYIKFSIYPSTENVAYEVFFKAGSEYYYFNLLHGTATPHSGISTNSTIRIERLKKWYTFTLPLSSFSTSTGVSYHGGWIDTILVGAYNPSTTVYFDNIELLQ